MAATRRRPRSLLTDAGGCLTRRRTFPPGYGTNPRKETSVKKFAAVLALSVLAHGTVGAVAIIDVHVFNFDFSVNPKGEPTEDPVINVGDSINWVFDEGFHNVSSVADSAESFRSGPVALAPQPDFSHTFTQVGTFTYICEQHGIDLGDGTATGMFGTVTVVPEPGAWGVMAGGALLGGAMVRRAVRAVRSRRQKPV